jgi:hypothetical protein
MKKQTKTNLYKKQKQISIIAFSLVMLLLGSYVYFVNITISTIAQHKEIKDSISDIEAESTYVEEKYLLLQDSVSIEMAYNKGFIDVVDTKFVSRDIRVSLYE